MKQKPIRVGRQVRNPTRNLKEPGNDDGTERQKSRETNPGTLPGTGKWWWNKACFLEELKTPFSSRAIWGKKQRRDVNLTVKFLSFSMGIFVGRDHDSSGNKHKWPTTRWHFGVPSVHQTTPWMAMGWTNCSCKIAKVWIPNVLNEWESLPSIAFFGNFGAHLATFNLVRPIFWPHAPRFLDSHRHGVLHRLAGCFFMGNGGGGKAFHANVKKHQQNRKASVKVDWGLNGMSWPPELLRTVGYG